MSKARFLIAAVKFLSILGCGYLLGGNLEAAVNNYDWFLLAVALWSFLGGLIVGWIMMRLR